MPNGNEVTRLLRFLNTCFVDLQIIIKLVNCNLNFNNQNLISIQQKKEKNYLSEESISTPIKLGKSCLCLLKHVRKTNAFTNVLQPFLFSGKRCSNHFDRRFILKLKTSDYSPINVDV